MSNKQIFICKTCLIEIGEHQVHAPEECIKVLQDKLIASKKEIDKWKNAWWDQRDATGRVAWEFINIPIEQIKNYKESFARTAHERMVRI